MDLTKEQALRELRFYWGDAHGKVVQVVFGRLGFGGTGQV
jgi:hypothetical protein